MLNPNSSAYKKAKRHYIKTTKNRPHHLELDWTPFRAAEKKYKARFPPPDLSAVLDLATLDPTRVGEINQGVWAGRPDTIDFKLVADKAVALPSLPGAPMYVSSVQSS